MPSPMIDGSSRITSSGKHRSKKRLARQSLEPLEPRRLMAANAYLEQDLASNGAVSTPHTDSHLRNAWGLVAWGKGMQVANADSGFTTGYDATGASVISAVRVPGPGNIQGSPTGIVYNTSASSFLVTNGSTQTASQFIFATEDGTIDAWSTLNKNQTVALVNNQSAQHAVYKGLAEASANGSFHLYATNFTLGRIDVFNSSFQLSHFTSTFVDPTLPAHYVPFNIQLINGQLFVTYAKRVKGASDPLVGVGAGVVDVFDTSGQFVKRFATSGKLNAPWGMAQAPANFGAFSNDILIGNFGDGKINAFDPTTGAFKGQLANVSNQPIAIDGLWGLVFGNGRGGTLKNGLYFTAGPNHEANGLYGRLIVDPYVAPASTSPTTAPYTPMMMFAKAKTISMESLLSADSG